MMKPYTGVERRRQERRQGDDRRTGVRYDLGKDSRRRLGRDRRRTGIWAQVYYNR
jgi:hypothetical protein